jgi:hypothetical protein
MSCISVNHVAPKSLIADALPIIPQFDWSKLLKPSVVGIVGRRGSGKSVFSNWLVSTFKRNTWNHGIAMTPVQNTKQHFASRFGDSNVAMSPTQLRQLYECAKLCQVRQQYQRWGCVLMDSMWKDMIPIVTDAAKNADALHYDLIYDAQNMMDTPPVLRDLTPILVFTHCASIPQRRKFWQICNKPLTEALFHEVFSHVTTDFGVLVAVADIASMDSNKNVKPRQLYWSRANLDESEEKFELNKIDLTAFNHKHVVEGKEIQNQRKRKRDSDQEPDVSTSKCVRLD